MARRKLDDYPTESSLARQLTGVLAAGGYFRTMHECLEPCAGAGRLAGPLTSVFDYVYTNDINKNYDTDWHFDATVYRPDIPNVWSICRRTNWVISNPPFSEALPIVSNALAFAKVGVAMLLRLSFLEPTQKSTSRAKYPRKDFWEVEHDRLRFVVPIGSPRPSFTDGGTDSVTTAWFIWDKGWSWEYEKMAPPFQFITDWRGT